MPAIGVGAAVYFITGFASISTLGLVGRPNGLALRNEVGVGRCHDVALVWWQQPFEGNEGKTCEKRVYNHPLNGSAGCFYHPLERFGGWHWSRRGLRSRKAPRFGLWI